MKETVDRAPRDNDQHVAAAKLGSAAQRPEQVNILLVDDQPANLLALEAILESLGQRLIKARSGAEAIALAADEDFAVILLDVQMPGFDGFETARRIRAQNRSRHAPIIFLTAYDRGAAALTQGYSLGAVDFLSKPLVPEVLRSKVGVFVALRQMTDELRRQGELLRETERREHERHLAHERQRWEMERLRAEAAREKKIAADLAEADRRKDEFLAMLAHELRNPLAPMVNALHVMRLRDGGDAMVREMRDLIDRQVRHMSRLVDDLLDVSRITRGKIQLRIQRLELMPLVQRAVEAARPLIESRKHRLHLACAPAAIWIDADATRMEQIITNLLANAAKYTEEGGNIWLECEQRSAQAIVRVRDSGIGISAEMLPRIFDLFIQADRSLDRSQGGLGIGLTLVRRLVELHGGTVQARSPGPGKGSEFEVQLPAQPPAQRPETPAVPLGAAVCQPRKVLVVDDSQDVAQSLAVLLQMDGHEVRTVHHGQAALQAVRSQRPDVILLDIGLPGMDGFEVAKQIRRQEGLADTLLVALTGYGQEQDRARCHEAGFDLHLVKPVDPNVLREMVALAHLTKA